MPLVRELGQEDPSARPDAVEALACFRRLVSEMSAEALAVPIQKYNY
jgi:hypothetical protein